MQRSTLTLRGIRLLRHSNFHGDVMWLGKELRKVQLGLSKAGPTFKFQLFVMFSAMVDPALKVSVSPNPRRKAIIADVVLQGYIANCHSDIQGKTQDELRALAVH
jgi:hypothetical protein